MTQRVSAKYRQVSALKMVPRNAGSIAIVGFECKNCIEQFKPFNPICTQTGFANWQDFGQYISENPSSRFDALLVLADASSLSMTPKILTAMKACLADAGALVVEIENPFYFERFQLDASSLGQSQLQALKKKVQVISKDILEKIAGSGLLVDRVSRPGSGSARFDNWQQDMVSDQVQQSEIWSELKPILAAASFNYRLIAKPVPVVHIQSQILKPTGGVNDVRIHEPLSALMSLPGFSATASRAERILPPLKNGNRIFLWHRPVLTFEQNLSHIQALRKQGYLIVTEFDDHYSPWPAIEANKFLSFAGVHAVQTTTPKLGDMFREFNHHVAVFPNQLNFLPERDLSNPSAESRIFFGALNRQKDWQPIMGEINAALARTTHPFHVDVVFDKEFFDALETDRKSFTPHCSYAIYKSRLLKADISLMPLSPTGFNEMKSDLKLIEAAGHGAVAIASDVVYGGQHGNTDYAIICGEAGAYGAALSMLLEKPEYRLQMQRRARDYVKENRLLSQHLDQRKNWYLDLLKRREQLDQELKHRLAQMMA